MIFGLIIIVLILLVAFFHMVQGFFGATLSAIFSVIAAAVAIGFHENAVAAFKPGKLADSANAIILCVLFAVTYVVLRLIFDRLVPGNVRFQSTIDKVGGALVGLVAGIMSAGVLAIAAQTMSFGPSIFGYARYELSPDREVNVIPDREKTQMTRMIMDQLKSDAFVEADKHTLMLPADDIVLKLVSNLSEGSLSGVRPLNSVHADYLQEAFANRIGIEMGAKRTATNLDTVKQVSVDRIAFAERLKSVEDAEFPEIRPKKDKPAKPETFVAGKDEAKLAKDDLKATGKQVLLILRTTFDKNATDEKGDIVRFTPASVRLVVHDPATGAAKNYHPIGTMDAWGGGTFWPNRIDDLLFVRVAETNGADLVFLIEDRDEVMDGAPEAPRKDKPAAKAAAPATIKANVYMEFKRLARVDLANMTVDNAPLPPDPKIEVMRKTRLKAPPPPAQ